MNGSCSSVGQSVGLMSRRSRVQAPPGPFFNPFFTFYLSDSFLLFAQWTSFTLYTPFVFHSSLFLLPHKIILKKKQRNAHWFVFLTLFTPYILLRFVLFAKTLSYIFLRQILLLFLHSDHLLPFILLLYFTQVCSFCQKKILKKKQRNAHWSFFYPFYSYILLKFVLLQKKTKIEMKEE